MEPPFPNETTNLSAHQPSAKVIHRLHQLFTRVHHERAILGNRLVQGFAGNQQNTFVALADLGQEALGGRDRTLRRRRRGDLPDRRAVPELHAGGRRRPG